MRSLKQTYHTKIILFSSAILAVSAFLLSGILVWLLYETAFDEQQKRLTETAQSQARLIEAMARSDLKHLQKEEVFAAVMNQLTDAHNHYQGFGETGEFTLAKREAEQIVFLLRHRHLLEKHQSIPVDSQLAEPMRQALQGHSGTLIGLDYRGELVLAAYEPVAILNLGIVAKIDKAEIRTPFIYAGFIALGITFLIIGIGVMTFLYLVNPIIIQVKNSEEKLQLSEKRYKSLVHSIDGVVWEALPNTFQFTFISQQAKRFFGYPLEDWLTQPTFWADHIHSDDKVWATAFCAEATAKQRGHCFEYRMITAENDIIWVRDLVTVVVENGQTVKICGVMFDITRQKRIEKALQQSQASLSHA